LPTLLEQSLTQTVTFCQMIVTCELIGIMAIWEYGCCISHWPLGSFFYFLTPRSSVTAQPMLMKLETYNYCRKTTHHAKRYCDRTTLVVWTNIQLLQYGFFLCLFWFLGCTGHTGEPILTTNMLYNVFACIDVPFGGSVDISPHIGVRSPKNVILGV